MTTRSDSGFLARPRAAEAAERGWRAVQLRAQRKTFQQIADELGLGSKASAYKAYMRHLALMKQESPESELLRVAESEYVDYLKSVVAPAIATGDLAAVDRGLRLSERYSKLNGLDLSESRAAGALEAGAVAQLMASSNLHAGIIAAMGKIGMPLEMQDRLIEAINEWLAEQPEPEHDEEDAEPESLAGHLIIEGETEGGSDEY